MWWYIVVFVGSFAMAMATVYTSGSGLPWWVYLIIYELNDSHSCYFEGGV